MLTDVTDRILKDKYNYNIDEAVGAPESKLMGMYPMTILPCTAFPIVVQVTREMKKRESTYNKLLLGPKLAPRQGIDVKKKDIWRSAKPTTYFLSHAWGPYPFHDHDRVCQLGAELKKVEGVTVFLDKDDMTGDTKKTMAAGIKATKVVLVFISQSYIDRVEASCENNCLFEWEAACNLKKKIYPVVIDPNLRNPSSWGTVLSAKLGGLIYSDFVEDSNMQICVDTIMKETSGMRF